MSDNRILENIDNYIYFHHLKSLVIVPSYPDTISDTMAVNFAQSTPLGRSAPIYSFSNSGPRTINVDLKLHRELMTQVNYQNSKLNAELNDDVVDTFLKQIRASALPEYSASSKMVNPPIISCKFGKDIFCKGVVSGAVGVSYELPIIGDGKYAYVGVSFTLQEIEPYDASTVFEVGGYRGLTTSLERNIYKTTRR